MFKSFQHGCWGSERINVSFDYRYSIVKKQRMGQCMLMEALNSFWEKLVGYGPQVICVPGETVAKLFRGQYVKQLNSAFKEKLVEHETVDKLQSRSKPLNRRRKHLHLFKKSN